MVVDKVGHVMDYAGNSDKTTAVIDFTFVVVLFHDWQLLEGNPPVDLIALLVELFL